jgi:hypothetical protein
MSRMMKITPLTLLVPAIGKKCLKNAILLSLFIKKYPGFLLGSFHQIEPFHKTQIIQHHYTIG